MRSVFAVFSIDKIHSLSVVYIPSKSRLGAVRQRISAFRHIFGDRAAKAGHAGDWRYVRAIGDAGVAPGSTGRSWKIAYADLTLKLERMCDAAKACAKRGLSSHFSRHKTWRFLLRRTAISIAVHDVSAFPPMQDGRHCCADLVFLMPSHDVSRLIAVLKKIVRQVGAFPRVPLGRALFRCASASQCCAPSRRLRRDDRMTQGTG